MSILIAAIYLAGAVATAIFVARTCAVRNTIVTSALRTTPTETGLYALVIAAFWPAYWPAELLTVAAYAIGKWAERAQQQDVIIEEEE